MFNAETIHTVLYCKIDDLLELNENHYSFFVFRNKYTMIFIRFEQNKLKHDFIQNTL